MVNELPKPSLQMNEVADFVSKARAALERAKLFNDWDFPLTDAATDAAEMTYVDWAYWCYKKEKPTLNAETGVLETLFLHNKSAVKLPSGFKTDTSLTIGAAGDLLPFDGIELSKDLFF